MTSLVVSGLVKGFGTKPVLTGLDLRVEPATITSILGPSGSGKTTLLRVICGFERAQSGSVMLDDEVVDDATHFVPPERRRIGYVPQEGNLFPHLSIAANVRFGLRRGAEARRRVTELLEMIGLADRARSYPHQLSGGQQQRVALARALAVSPRLVLLDEPFASLDASLRASVRGDVVHILREAGATALLVTHDQDEALSLSDSVAVIRGGVIAQLGTPRQVYTQPADAGLARFVGAANLLSGTIDGNTVITRLGRLPMDSDGPALRPGDVARDGAVVAVMVRPEQLMLRTGTAADGSACEVIDHEFYGHDAVVRLRPLRSTTARRGDAALPVDAAAPVDPAGSVDAAAPVDPAGSVDAAAPVDPAESVLVARVRGGAAWPRGTIATVTVDGPVVVWSRM